MARKMKDSGIEWIGEIPEGWKTCHYKYCCSVQPGYPFDSAKFSNSSTDGFPLIRIRDITSGEIQTYYTGEYPPNYIVTAGDLLVGMDGDFNVRWWNNDAALLNQRCCRVTEKDSVLRRFLYYVLPFTLQHINTLTYATTVKHLANGDILNSFIAFPSLPAQQNIVHYLDTVCSEIDAMLSKTRSSIEEYKKLKQSVITQAVTKGVRGEREMKDSGVDWIGEIPAEWSVAKAKYYVTIMHGSDPKTEGSIPVYGSGAESFKTCGEYKEGPTVLIGRKGATLHIPHYIEGKYWNVDTAFDVKAKNNFSLPYYYYLATSFDYKFYIAQTTLPGMTQSNYYNMFLPLPTFPEQEEIVNYLDAKCAEIDGLIAKKEQLVRELESYKKSLIYEVVTGKREV
ncbi:MAG: restriction endonuclease subunit S [Faecalibacterium sp.]|nr:restriction endonuclease subunit S [Faecalibacterium sp.]